MYFGGGFLAFAPLILDSNKKVTNWISTRISSEGIKPFNANLELTMCNLTNGRTILKFNNSVLVQKRCSSMYSNFMLNLYILYELNTGHEILPIILFLKCLFGTFKLTKKGRQEYHLIEKV